MPSYQSRYLLLFCILFSVLLSAEVDAAPRNKLHDASWQRTFEAYREVGCLSSDELDFGKELILGLDYNSRRVFRKLSRLKGMNFERSKEAWDLLLSLDLSYEQVLAFETWSGLDNVDITLALSALPGIQTLSYEEGKSFRQYCSLPRITPRHALKTIPLLNRLNDARNRAVQDLITIKNITADQALDGLRVIARMGVNRARAAGAFARLPGMTISMLNDGLPVINLLDEDSAWNARTLFLSGAVDPAEAWFWLISYFANPTDIREQQFQSLDDRRRQTLLQAFYRGGEELIWKINNLHAITDRFGFEISSSELRKYSSRQLEQRFEKLSPRVKSEFGNRFYRAGRAAKRKVLKEATAAERVETARQLTSANIYALLAQGSELYDSSFRNILVPILKKYIRKNHADNLLHFLKVTDPANLLVSSFIVSLAQKGKLTTFFPEDPGEQQQVLNLVAESAFRDEDSIILFSATFMYLLEVLRPEARTCLITRMSEQADAGTVAYARLITVILQYYMQEFPHLLGTTDKTVITRLVVRHGAINLHKYLATPFGQWKEDNLLQSVSIFHPDDDGRDSFLSNARILLKSGYRLSLSDQFSTGALDAKTRTAVNRLIRDAMARPAPVLPLLFNSMLRRHYSVRFEKELNNITIRHNAVVYGDEARQEIILERFIQGGVEMFAQRGHSYWRSEQITDPLTRLLEQNRVSDNDLRAKQRFLSLGSCGGVKAYTRLTRMFAGHVDILATIGTGLASINDPYNKNFFEIVAGNPATISWKDVSMKLTFIFKGGHGRDYLQPGSLPAILHKILDGEKTTNHNDLRKRNLAPPPSST